jgi:hypothetical protein
MAYNFTPGQKIARLGALKKLTGQHDYESAAPSMKGPTVGTVTPVGPLASLKEKEQKQMSTSIPLTTAKGLKESQTKKLKPKM